MLLLLFLSTTTKMTSYNIIDFGAKNDNITDSANAFIGAWKAACRSMEAANVSVPAGRFLLSRTLFEGPCNNSDIRVLIEGIIVAPSNYSALREWVTFKHVEGVSIYGGTLDAQGQALWDCKNSSRRCPAGATTLTVMHSNNVTINGVNLINSEMFHMSIYGSSNVTVQAVNITAPGDSPNTDGIHIHMSSAVTVTNSVISTGDDCISMGHGTNAVWIENITCGPGHGISIGSLGGGATDEAGVANITVKTVIFSGTQNGIRIKTWANPIAGFVTNVTFENITMNFVDNPIIVDQNYCPRKTNCPNMTSDIAISQISYMNITGSSATLVAVKFACSPTKPCSGISMQNIMLTYDNKPALALCQNVNGTTVGLIVPESYL
ncbi:polygalacturonase-like [Dioscorea cayenensis subsp. rotundata]|uniref:Exopolygalacturonase n=1 Tax=Dioscorea cayennensis subsp. rotundata TaxID=55577 RepID=A0AB40BGT6_DIOCR|nr:polygalacturonase-like [Dioscorea cayenensis subsp. rotundata]